MSILLVLALWLQVAAPAQVPACQYQGLLPDSSCTPGATSGATLDQVCTPGYATSVRPSSAYTSRLKREQMRAYGVAGMRPAAFEEDHLISLELGGDPTSPANLWPEPIAEARVKDHVENVSHDAVCRGDLDLGVAQQWIAADWYGLGVFLGVLDPEGS